MNSTFQDRVNEWMQACFGSELSKDKLERNKQFLEKALELVQSLGCTSSTAHQLVAFVFSRTPGQPFQQCGSVMIALAALSSAASLDMKHCGETELENAQSILEQKRLRQKGSPKILNHNRQIIHYTKHAS